MASRIVTRVDVVREEILYDHPTAGAEIREALAAISGCPDFRLPLAKERVAIELNGVPTAVANALRRVVTDEMRGQCLDFSHESFDYAATTDPHMDEHFVRLRIKTIPLRPQIPEDIVKQCKYTLYAENTTDVVMTVYSGDLRMDSSLVCPDPLFNPTHELFVLQPGRTISVNDIRIFEGIGRQDSAFEVGVRAVARPLDLKEHPREATHSEGGIAANDSGFIEKSFVANPRRHEVSVYFRAVPAGGRVSRAIFDDVCGVIIERLNYVRMITEEATAAAKNNKSSKSVTYQTTNATFLITPDGNRIKGVLAIRAETDTIGQLLARLIYEHTPTIGHVNVINISHENTMTLTIAHAVPEPEDICAIIAQAVQHAIAIYEQIRREIKQA